MHGLGVPIDTLLEVSMRGSYSACYRVKALEILHRQYAEDLYFQLILSSVLLSR